MLKISDAKQKKLIYILCIMYACVYLAKLNYGALAVEIIKHPNLAGDWECDGKKYTIYGPRECEGVPSCSTCCADKIMRADQEQYEQSFAHKHRNEKEWTCPTCGITAPPECLGCKKSIRWVTKKLTRMAIYPPWDNVQDAGRDLF